ncbi:2-hydroxyacid dehydrogenase [Actinomadura welshii]|uniref:2-hydroxyacid dehydrogenase n=1 Tax=Actinomadura welshii TaxID=3103817 RepID=UPI0003AD2964|nr:2-hydroxyacid dehydrogenase [Actinomadura madurae]
MTRFTPDEPTSVTGPVKVLQVGALLPSLHRRLREHHDVVLLDEQDEAYLDEHGAEFTALVTRAAVGVGKDLIDRLPRLRVITSFGVGYDTIDVAAASARGVQVSNTPDVLNDCVADVAVGGLIDVMRRMTDADRYLRRGDWHAGPYPLTTKVSGKRVGVLGLGRIGRAVARRLEGFDIEVAYHSRHPVDGVDYRYVESVDGLAAWSDALVIAVAGGDGTRGLVSASTLEALGPAGHLVNIARGSVVDEPALVDALVNGRIAGAALDVFADEPNVPDELLPLGNVLLLPHIASATHETREAMGDLVFRNLQRFLSDGTLITPV